MDETIHPKHDFLHVMRPMYARQWLLGPAPRHAIPEDGMPPSTAYHLIHDELIMDGSSRFNLATFCGTWMEPEAQKLMSETFDKNMIDKDEYPQTAELEMRCVHMLAELWNAPEPGEHHRHFHHRLQRGLHARRPGAQMALARAARAKPANPPTVPTSSWARTPRSAGTNSSAIGTWRSAWFPLEGDGVVTDPERAAAMCDENTIGVVAVLGSTFTGDYEDVAASAPRSTVCRKRPASISRSTWMAPAELSWRHSCSPKSSWDFRLPRVKSINTSGHKYGLVFPGVGWVIWREASDLHPELVFNVDYLGRHDAHAGHQFFAAGQPGGGAVLQPDPPGQVGLPRHPPGLPGGRRASRQTDRAKSARSS